MEPAECDKFMVALHYVYGSALMRTKDTAVSRLVYCTV